MPSEPYYQREGVRLYHADCREVLPTLGSVDFVFTDPPYGHNNNNNGDLIHRREAALGKGPHGEARAIANDGAADTAQVVQDVLPMLSELLPPGHCCCCCCGGGGPDPQFARWSLLIDEHIGFKQMVIWDKGPMGMGWHYRRSYETVLVAEKPGAACRWFDETNCVENIIRPGFMGIRKIIPSKQEHPTPKPWQLAAYFMRLHSQPGDIVLDPFTGGGSTAEAAVHMGRRFVGIELDEKWCEHSARRVDRILDQPRLPFVEEAAPAEQKGLWQ